jgi:hypothetical protein
VKERKKTIDICPFCDIALEEHQESVVVSGVVWHRQVRVISVLLLSVVFC